MEVDSVIEDNISTSETSILDTPQSSQPEENSKPEIVKRKRMSFSRSISGNLQQLLSSAGAAENKRTVRVLHDKTSLKS